MMIPTIRPRRRAACAALALWLAALVGCHSNPHDYQDTPPILRLVTIPAGATVVLEDMRLRLETPCDLPTELGLDDELSVSKEGCLPFHGTLRDLVQISRGTFELRLQRPIPAVTASRTPGTVSLRPETTAPRPTRRDRRRARCANGGTAFPRSVRIGT